MVLVFISVLKVRRNNTKKQISFDGIFLDEVSQIYQNICPEFNFDVFTPSILPLLKRLELAGFIKLSSSKKSSTKIIEIYLGGNTPLVIENLLYNDLDYAKYKSFYYFPSN